MKRLVFIPTYSYLSHPIFFSIARCAQRFHTVYFNTKDPLFAVSNREISPEEMVSHFDEYCEAAFVPRKKRKSILLHHLEVQSALEDQLSTLEPDVIITTSDMGGYLNRMCNMWAEKKGIPFIVIQPSFIPLERVGKTLKENLFYFAFNNILGIPLCTRQKVFGNERPSNYLFLWGEYFKNFYRGLEIEKNIRITGNPAFDSIFQNEAGTDLGVSIPEGTPVITICTQPLDVLLSEKVFKKVNDFFKTLIEENPDLFFVVKVHPREDTKKYDCFNTSNSIILRDVPFHAVLRRTHVQVSVSSYTSFEAAVSKVPIVLIDPNIQLFDYFNNEIGLVAATKEMTTDLVRKCLSPAYQDVFAAQREQYLKPRLGALDGRSGERVIRMVEEILEG
jgi:hypothetical protein